MKHALCIAAAAFACSIAFAAPAAWFKWHSPLADYDVCAQISPGDDWYIVKGPFEDSGCKKALRN